MRIVDRWQAEKLTFFESKLKTQSSADELQVDGLCAQLADQESILWQLHDEEFILREGEVSCKMGGFRISVDYWADIPCGQSKTLVAVSEDGGQAEINVTRSCDANS